MHRERKLQDAGLREMKTSIHRQINGCYSRVRK